MVDNEGSPVEVGSDLFGRWSDDERHATNGGPDDASGLGARMDGGYQPLVLSEPRGGPVPDGTDGPTEEPDIG